MEFLKEYIGKNVKRKNLNGGDRYYFVLGYSDLLGYKLYETITDATINITPELFEKKFKVLK